MQTVGSVEPVSVWRGLLKARLRVEHAYYEVMDTLQVFKKYMGCWGGFVLCGGGRGLGCTYLTFTLVLLVLMLLLSSWGKWNSDFVCFLKWLNKETFKTKPLLAFLFFSSPLLSSPLLSSAVGRAGSFVITLPCHCVLRTNLLLSGSCSRQQMQFPSSPGGCLPQILHGQSACVIWRL